MSTLPCLDRPLVAGVPAWASLWTVLYAGQAGRLELRAIRKPLPPKRAFFEPHDHHGLERFIAQHSDRDVYFGVAVRRDDSGGDLANCAALPALFADLDCKDFPDGETGARAAAAACPMPPSATVATGGGLHLYWRLRASMNLPTEGAEAKRLLKALARALRGDPISAEPVHVLRVPGTRNHKYDPARPVVLEELEADRVYDLADFEWLPMSAQGPAVSAKPVLVAPVVADRDHVLRRARAYADAVPGAVEGQGGDSATYRLACALARDFALSSSDTLEVMRTWNGRCAPPWTEQELVAKVNHALRYGTGPVGTKAVDRRVVAFDKRPSAESQTEGRLVVEAASVRALSLTDAAQAERFAEAFGDRFRFDHTRGAWLAWTGSRWALDGVGERYAQAVVLARGLYQRAQAEPDLDLRRRLATFAISCESRTRLDAVLHLARFHPRMAERGDAWDVDPWVLNTPTGLIDLRTGLIRPATPADLVTFQTSVPVADRVECARWLRFLREVFRDDQAVIAWLQKVLGYALTGLTVEQFLVIAFGAGANGKSTLFSLVAWLLGDYALNLPFASFELFDRSAIPNDLATLRGRRFVTASETQDGARLNEARIKALTGGDTLTARFLHGEFFQFTPVCKLFLFVNHRPVVRDDSHGFWRRVRLLPFLQRFPVNATLADELRAEGPGILRWCLEGCLAWQRDGLTVPDAVDTATRDYETDSDPLAPFLEACCAVDGDRSARAGELYGRYRQWCDEANLAARERLSMTAFGRRLKSRFKDRKDRLGCLYLGVGLRAA